MGETHRLSDQVIRLSSALSTSEQAESSASEKLTFCRIRPMGCRQHSAPQSKRSHLHGRNSLSDGSGHRAVVSTQHLRASGVIWMGETHLLSDQAIGLSSALGTKERVREPFTWEILTCCRIRPSGSGQLLALETS